MLFRSATWAKILGRPNLAEEDVRFATVGSRIAHLDVLSEMLLAWACEFPDVESIERVCEENGLAMGMVRSTVEASMSEHSVARNSVMTVSDRRGGRIAVSNSPWRFSESESGVRGKPKYRGEDNREVLGGLLGLSDTELEQLETSGVLLSRIPAERD